MTLDDVRSLQGRSVSLALADKSRIDDAVRAGVVKDERLWLNVDGRDLFVAVGEVVEVWERPTKSQ